MQTYVKYKHGYAQYTIAPGIQTIVPVPYTLVRYLMYPGSY